MRMLILFIALAFTSCHCDLTPLHEYCPVGQACWVDVNGNVFLSGFPDFVGECHTGNVRACENGNPICDGYQGPQPEDCNGLDDDCNGAIDDVLVEPDDSVLTCSSVGVCINHLKECVNGNWTCFYPNLGPEICDNRDNDCNGLVDDGISETYSYPDDQYPGTDGIGPCRPAITQCVHGHEHTLPAVTPVPEICNNGIDDNCDGFIDEGPQLPPRAYMLSLDISPNMEPYLQIIVDTYCSVAFSAEMSNTMTAIAITGNVDVTFATVTDYHDAPTACGLLQGLSIGNGSAYMYEAVDMAEDSAWPTGYPVHHDLAFTDEPVNDASPWTTPLAELRTECVGLYDVVVFSDPTTFASDWVSLVQSCGGTEEDITDTATLQRRILDQLVAPCVSG